MADKRLGMLFLCEVKGNEFLRGNRRSFVAALLWMTGLK
jgi:hypothetical protein